MTVARIPVHASRDRKGIADYLIEVAGHVAADRVANDPYGVVVIFIGPEDVTLGSRGVVYRHDYERAVKALRMVVR